ncbi:MAG TPA: hypothetical protein VME17_11540 [Bryobacteraceae bacterium]|nr:hypothetical protein [Bryobacteraceae bacterium]
MIFSRVQCWIAAAALTLPIFAQAAPAVVPIPSDANEIVRGPIESANTPEGRGAAAELLTRARDAYALRTAGRGYDLKVTFTVNSGGQTQYDGVWQMEDWFAPGEGLRWTANSGAFSITEIFSNGKSYVDGTSGYIPLRLHEARAALFGTLPSPAAFQRDAIRTSTATFEGTQVTCILFSAKKGATDAPVRRWDETEECIDPQSGLLRVVSQVPGRYSLYDYSNAPQLVGHMLPRTVTVTEGGKTVSKISVESITELTSADQSLFTPTPAMLERGQAIAMLGAEKISHVVHVGAFPYGATPHVVCVFGVVTPTGELVEAHSLQPSDPFSANAIATAKQIKFAQPPKPGEVEAPLEQHFVFVIEKFLR